MKTKNKMIAMLEIAIVLCSVFLVATLPAIAVQDQNQEMQKASASAYTPKPFIYGDATEDGTVDMGDVIYIKLAIFGEKPKTKLADAKYDDRINVLDVIQTKLIILDKEKQLTLLDMADRTVTVPRPVERVVCAEEFFGVSLTNIDPIVHLGAADKLVGVHPQVCKLNEESAISLKAHPELKELPGAESMETILSLNPDVIFDSASYTEAADAKQENTGIPVICTHTSGNLDFEVYRLVGTAIGKEKEAEELISYAKEKIDEVTEVTSEIPEDEKPKVYFAVNTFIGDITKTTLCFDPLDLAGGINVVKGSIFDPGPPYIRIYPEISIEQIIAWNPDIIMLHGTYLPKEKVLSDPILQTINAVKNGQVYHTKGAAWGWDSTTMITEIFYMAKLFYPDKFEDLDVEKEGNEILERFYGVDGLYTEMAESFELHRWE